MLSWSLRSINTVIFFIQLVLILLHSLHWSCTVKHKQMRSTNLQTLRGRMEGSVCLLTIQLPYWIIALRRGIWVQEIKFRV
jgi:hypothetical protein